MYARVTTTPISPYRVEEAVHLAEETTMPAARKQPGFKGYLMLVDKSNGMAITITFWQDENDRLCTSPGSAYYKDSISQLVPMLTGAPAVEDYDVVLQV
jgi:quinol monooxygenase YgiN